MPPFALYFNEHSIPPAEIQTNTIENWKNWALEFYACLREAQKLQPDFILEFPVYSWHHICNGKPFSVWMKSWLGNQKYSWVLLKLRTINQPPNQSIDVYFNDIRSMGFTRSYLAKSWSISIPIFDSPWITTTIDAMLYHEAGDDIRNVGCQIKNLAYDNHVVHWEEQLAEWGHEVAYANVIGWIQGLEITMFPFDHGYPHIHIINPQLYDAKNHRKTLAKFRVDRFERMEGHPRWDTDLKGWIEIHRDQLLDNWKRCQIGLHPFKVDD